ncbi:hypothetical protein DFH08DRAFT_820930 [Mycena albidolilacea]|uniref:Uncharacterized protein n=1 Tax=Mycena albidolilacea TaxID=1033008 RepID=A0AAD7EEW0_9AGAR|nr:hypothetical protein DFH08DRAFT_820930 [Mycena albidolilacea]
MKRCSKVAAKQYLRAEQTGNLSVEVAIRYLINELVAVTNEIWQLNSRLTNIGPASATCKLQIYQRARANLAALVEECQWMKPQNSLEVPRCFHFQIPAPVATFHFAIGINVDRVELPIFIPSQDAGSQNQPTSRRPLLPIRNPEDGPISSPNLVALVNHFLETDGQMGFEYEIVHESKSAQVRILGTVRIKRSMEEEKPRNNPKAQKVQRIPESERQVRFRVRVDGEAFEPNLTLNLKAPKISEF